MSCSKQDFFDHQDEVFGFIENLKEDVQRPQELARSDLVLEHEPSIPESPRSGVRENKISIGSPTRLSYNDKSNSGKRPRQSERRGLHNRHGEDEPPNHRLRVTVRELRKSFSVDRGCMSPAGSADKFTTLNGKQDKVRRHDVPAGRTLHEPLQALKTDAIPHRENVRVPALPAADITQLFSGCRFYFVPNARTNTARSMRMDKVAQYGGVVLSHFKISEVTHIIVDKNINAAIVLRTISETKLPDSIKVYNELWTPDCVVYGRLIESSTRYYILGLEPPKSCVALADVAEVDAGEIDSDDAEDTAQPSLQIKQPRRSRYVVPTEEETDSRQTMDVSDARISPTVAFAISSSDSTARIHETQVPKDELAEAMTLLHNLGSTPLDEEIEDLEQPADASTHDSIDERDVKRQWERNFKCMKSHVTSSAKAADPNDFLIGKLEIMQNYYETSKDPEDRWKPRGYRLAIGSLRNSPVPVTTYENARKLPNIGDRLAKHIEEIAKTGTMSRAENLGENYALLTQFMGIYGVGPAKANEYLQRGFRSLEDILAHGSPSTNQRIGIELYNDLNSRIPRAEVLRHIRLVETEAAKIDLHLQVYVMGSFRRGSKDCGDIDIMLTRRHTTTKELRMLWQRLLDTLRKSLHYLTHALVESSTSSSMKWQGICNLGEPGSLYRRIDFLLVPWEQRGTALLYFTGNDLFNRSMRLLARKKGYTLNEKALMRGALRDRNGIKITQGQNTGAQTEEDVFRILGIPFRRPEERCVS